MRVLGAGLFVVVGMFVAVSILGHLGVEANSRIAGPALAVSMLVILVVALWLFNPKGQEPTVKPEEGWKAELDEEETRLRTNTEVLSWLSDAESRVTGRVWVVQDLGPSTKWLRYIGGPKRDVRPHFAVEWSGDFARLIFLDDAWSEHRALDTTNPVAPSKEILEQISHGEPIAHPVEECMGKRRAFDAMREYLVAEQRPGWLSYRYVR
jgi:hypothetical protein